MAHTGITPSTLAHDLVLAVSSKGLWLEAGSSFHCEDPREHRRSAQALCDLWARQRRAGFDAGLSLSQTTMRLFAALEF